MKQLLRRLALLSVPVWLWLAFFIAFEPNNYFGLKSSASSSQPVARVRAYLQNPGTNLLLGDSRLAHMDMSLLEQTTGEQWQNLAFGGASLKETLDMAEYVLDSGNQTDSMVLELSFYTLNADYNTDRFAQLETTLNNPLAYCLNLEYNVNALTCFLDWVRHTPDTVESGNWTAADHQDENGNAIPLHYRLYVYPSLIDGKCQNWAVNEEQLARLEALAARCQAEGVRLTVVLPPMADIVKTEVCDKYGITGAMTETVLPTLQNWAVQDGFTLLDYEWKTEDSGITDDDTQFFDGFHLDEKYGLPVWTEILGEALK